MSELVSRTAVKKILSQDKRVRDFQKENDDIIFKAIDKATTVDLYRDVIFNADGSIVYRFRPKGKWIAIEPYNHKTFCPFCQKDTRDMKYDNFCPNCGSMLAEIGPEDSNDGNTKGSN